MPGWHAATESLWSEGRFRTFGIVQEQHGDRARLFMQWQGLDWPLAVDSLNLLEVPYVPITLAIDEHGVVRAIGPAPGELAESFLDVDIAPPGAAADTADGEEAGAAAPDPQPASEGAGTAGVRERERGAAPLGPVSDISRLKAEAVKSGTAEAWREYAQQLFLWGGPDRLSAAIEGFRRSIAVDDDHAPTHFRAGVALRSRYDGGAGRPGNPDDFQQAVASWGRALELDPNNYIWRRRIQQYGPRLDKPYSFYDWVSEARAAITARDETPLPLVAEPRGAELARPAREFEAADPALEEPDPEGRVDRDKGHFVRIETTVVPSVVTAGQAARVHLVLRPNRESGSHWNNEAGDTRLWIRAPEGWEVDPRSLSIARPRERVSQEPRQAEFEVRIPDDVPTGGATLPAYALYYVCEDVQSACLYRRQDLPLRLRVRAAPAPGAGSGSGSETP